MLNEKIAKQEQERSRLLRSWNNERLLSKASNESSMRKTGGKMNAACMFWDNNGNKTLSYNPESRNWKAISTEEEFARARVFTSIYNDELARLKKEYGENAKGTIS